MATSSISPCAACKLLRRKCQPECTFAPYFPPDQSVKFTNVHRLYGASNVSRLLTNRNADQREDTVNSLVYEAEMRNLDPVYGCVGVITHLNKQLRQLQGELATAKAQLSECYNLMQNQQHHLSSFSGATHNHHQGFPAGYGQNVDAVGVATGGNDGVWGRRCLRPPPLEMIGGVQFEDST